jgi:hypothetical protein
MTKIIVSEDCGNSPKNILIQKLTIAIAKRDTKFILDTVVDLVRWNIVGNQLIEGKENLAGYLKQSKINQISLLTIHHVASHGKAGAVDGTQKMENGEMFAYCDVYEFGNTKGTMISEIISYVIPIQ